MFIYALKCTRYKSCTVKPVKKMSAKGKAKLSFLHRLPLFRGFVSYKSVLVFKTNLHTQDDLHSVAAFYQRFNCTCVLKIDTCILPSVLIWLRKNKKA